MISTVFFGLYGPCLCYGISPASWMNPSCGMMIYTSSFYRLRLKMIPARIPTRRMKKSR